MVTATLKGVAGMLAVLLLREAGRALGVLPPDTAPSSAAIVARSGTTSPGSRRRQDRRAVRRSTLRLPVPGSSSNPSARAVR
jgi:hypothetical protein